MSPRWGLIYQPENSFEQDAYHQCRHIVGPLHALLLVGLFLILEACGVVVIRLLLMQERA